MSFIFAKIMAFITEKKATWGSSGNDSTAMRAVSKAARECLFSLAEGPLLPSTLQNRRLILGHALEFGEIGEKRQNFFGGI